MTVSRPASPQHSSGGACLGSVLPILLGICGPLLGIAWLILRH